MMTDKTETEIHVNSREKIGDERPTDEQNRAVTDEEKLEEALRDSMDASDPPAVTNPGDHGEPVPSSGFQEEDEEESADEDEAK